MVEDKFEKNPQESSELKPGDVRRELQFVSAEALLDWLDDMRSGVMEPAKKGEEVLDKAYIAEARRRARLLNEAADAAEEILSGRTAEERRAGS